MTAGMDEGVSTIGKRLKAARQEAGLTQQGLAKRSVCGLATIRRIEQGDMEPRAETARRLAKSLSIRAGWLMFGELPIAEEPRD